MVIIVYFCPPLEYTNGVKESLQVFRDGAAPMISAVCRDIGLTSTIDRIVSWDEKQCTRSPGLLVEAMIINALTRRCLLYCMDDFFRDVDVVKLFGPAVTSRQLNDSAMGRALDKVVRPTPRKCMPPSPCRWYAANNSNLRLPR